MFCTNCGNPLRDGAAFCPQCGTRTAAAEAPAATPADPELSELLARADLLVAEEEAQVTAPQQSAPVVPPAPPVAPPPQPVPPAAQPVYYAAAAATEPPKKKSRAGLIVLAVVLAALLMAVAAFLSWKFFLADDRDSTSQSDPNTDRDEESDDKDSEETDPEADADADTDADAAPGQEEDPAVSGDNDASTDAETPAAPEGPTEEELLSDVEVCIAAGQYDEAREILSQITDPTDTERFDMLFSAAILNPELASVDVSEFPTITIELHYGSTLFFAKEVILTEDGMPLTIDSMEQNDASGVAVYTCTAAPGEDRSLQRTIGVQIVFDAFELTAETNYQTPVLVSRYELFFADVSWDEAVAECEAMGGHLITITSGYEMEIAVDLAIEHDALYTWIGGYTTVGSDGVVAEWITGEPMDYQLWALGEPSGSDRDGTIENCMMLWNVPSLGGWSWNDQRPDPVGDGFYAGEIAFICEWEEYQS